MSWRERIAGIYEARGERDGIAKRPRFYPAASEEDLAAAEALLNARLPESLRSLLLETNGILELMAIDGMVIDGGDWFEAMWLLWNLAEIVEQNHFYRDAAEGGAYSRDFRRLAFFANAGCDGILFGFPMVEDRVCGPNVVVWSPIFDELEEVAPSLDDFLEGWVTGRISV